MGTIRKGILVLDPRTKILLLLGINIFVFTNSHVYAEMLVVAALVILLLLCGVYKTALKSTITYIVLLAIKCWILPFCPEIIMTSLNIVVITFRKLLPCVTLGALLVQTTPIRLLMHAMQKWHLPQAVIIPLAITVRYFPTLHEEQQAISDAMKLRNVHGVFQKLEYIYVPLMLSASTTADELSQASRIRRTDTAIVRSHFLPAAYAGSPCPRPLYAGYESERYCRNGGYHAITGGKIHPCRTAEAAPVLCSTEMDGQSMSISKEKRCLT